MHGTVRRYMSEMARNSVLRVLNEKGWNLYRSSPRSHLPSIVSNGKALFLEPNVPYVLLPVVDRDDDVEEVKEHMANAAQTKQLPTYKDATCNRKQVEWIMIDDSGLTIKVTGLGDVYFFGLNQMEEAAKRNFSNYNVHFFSSIDELNSYFRKHGIDVCPSVEIGELRWTLVEAGSPESVMIYPVSRPDLLFRGQYKRYRPCYPSVARNMETRSNALMHLSPIEQSRLILNLIRTAWFNKNLRKTSAMRWMSTQGLSFDENAVAQHYGLPTGYIDLSQSFAVASFFACCEYDAACGTWKPVTDGYGIIYAVDITRTPICGPAKPIGLQPFPRPSQQWGWVYEISMAQDFDALPHVRKFVFAHDACASSRILERFEGGARLFPRDPLSELAELIIRSRQIPKSIARCVVEDLIKDSFGLPGTKWEDVLVMLSRNKDVEFMSCDRMFTRLKSEMDAIWERRKSEMLRSGSVGVRLVRTVDGTHES